MKKLWCKIFKPESVDKLRNANSRLNQLQRNEIPILVIDDEPFRYLEDLRNHDFNIKHWKDLESIQGVEGFEVVLCDIKGVGKAFESEFEGAHLISEIKKRYPFKIVYGYSGSYHKLSYNKLLSVADDLIDKDISPDEWIQKLDFAKEDAKNTYNKWIRMRNYLIEGNIPLIDIAILEDEYVSLIEEGGDLSSFPSKTASKSLPPDIRAVLQSLAASIIFSIAFGTPTKI